jgi:hypothetical protein
MRSSRQILLSTVAGTVLATTLALAVVLSSGERTLAAAAAPSAWMGAWCAAAGLAVLAVLRRLAPVVPGAAPGLSWWLAGVLGAAVLGRHVLDTLAIAAAELPMDAAVPGPFDLGDLSLWALMLLVTLAVAGPRSGSHPGMRMGLGLIVMLAPAAVLLLDSLSRVRLDSGLPDLAWNQEPALAAAAGVWVLAMVICDEERASGRLGLASWLPPLLGCALLVALPWWLLSVHGGGGLERIEGAFFLRPGAMLFGSYGGRIGAGIESLATLAAIAALLCFSARSALMGRLFGSWERGVAVTSSAVLAALVPLPSLIQVAALGGWLAVIMGFPRSEARRAEEHR